MDSLALRQVDTQVLAHQAALGAASGSQGPRLFLAPLQDVMSFGSPAPSSGYPVLEEVMWLWGNTGEEHPCVGVSMSVPRNLSAPGLAQPWGCSETRNAENV